MNYPELHLWDVSQKSLLNRYRGHKQEKFIIKCAFGGESEQYLIAGSEDAKAYIWHINCQTPLEIVEGHSLLVSCIIWNPGNTK